jgi:hypothetical protein
MKVSNSIMNNWNEFFGGEGWGSYSDPASLGGQFSSVTGMKSCSRGFGKNSVSASFNLSEGLKVVLQLKKVRNKIHVDAFTNFPCWGLPLENEVQKIVDTVKVADNDEAITEAVLEVAQEVNQKKLDLYKDLGEVAKRNDEAKHLYLMTC